LKKGVVTIEGKARIAAARESTVRESIVFNERCSAGSNHKSVTTNALKLTPANEELRTRKPLSGVVGAMSSGPGRKKRETHWPVVNEATMFDSEIVPESGSQRPVDQNNERAVGF
jgi:hypothetical protein